jgi:thioredoxin
MVTAEIIRCPNCGAKNRIDPERIARGEEPVCGRCKKTLAATGSRGPIAVSDATWAAEVEQSPIPVLVDFWAAWCGPCRMIGPTIEQLASEFSGRAKVAKLNVDENQRTAVRLNISGIPALVVFKGGREVDRIVGVQPKPVIAQRLERFVG